MKKYTIFHPLILSFYSKSLYRDVANNWKGIGFGYLLLLVILTLLPLMWPLQDTIDKFMTRFAYPMVAQLPLITIQNGVATVDAQTPYFIKNPETGEVLAILDTTGQYTTVMGTSAEILMTKTQLVIRKDSGGAEVSELPKDKVRIEPGAIKSFVDKVRERAVYAAFLFLLGFFVMFRLFFVLLYSGVGVLLAKIAKVSLSYKTLVRLATVAITPALLIELVSGLSRFYFGFEGLPYERLGLYILLPVVYLAFGIYANRQ